MKLSHTLKILFFAIAIFLSNCSNTDSDKDGVDDEKDSCPNTPLNTKVDSKGCPIKEKEIGKIRFYIENSASNAGYFGIGQSTEFKTILCDLTTKINETIKPLSIYFISKEITQYPKTVQEFTSDIAKTQMATENGFELHKIIKSIASRNDSNDVSLFVSDCILSFPDEDIKEDREINKNEARNSLKNHIYSTFSDLKQKGLAASVYAFNSKFYGTYFDYQNGTHPLTGQVRPFYIWVIANKELLTKFNTKLSDISTFKPVKSSHFGLTGETVTKYEIIPQIERKGGWMKCSSGIEEIELEKKESLQFCIGLNLENLPVYAKEIEYLQKNLKLEMKGCEAELQVKDKSKVDKSKLKAEPQIKLFENATHIIIFKVNSMNLPDARINVTLPLQYDTWHMDWSCEDDKDITLAEKKTFALEYLILGVKDAYETKNKNYIDFSLTLKK